MPITWKNINAPDLRDSILATSAAGQSFGAAGDALTNLLNQHRTIQDGNWDNQAKINTDLLMARAKEIQDLQAFNAQKGGFDPAAVMPQMGRQYDPAQLAAGLKAHEQTLQQAAYNNVEQQAMGIQSPGQAAVMAQQALLGAGVVNPQERGQMVNQIGTAHQQGPGAVTAEQQDAYLAQKLQEIQNPTQGQQPGAPVQAQPVQPGQVPQVPLAPQPAQAAPVQSGTSGNTLNSIQDPLVRAVAKAESGGNPNAVSPKGAEGLMQLMPATAAKPGFGITPARDKSVEENLRVGSEYLAALNKKYGDQNTALAAYNWGPGNVDKWLEKGANPADLPKETRDYINRVNDNLAAETAAPAASVAPQVPVTARMVQALQAARDAQLAKDNAAEDRRHTIEGRDRAKAITEDTTAVMEHFKKHGNEAEALALVNGKDHQNEVRMNFVSALEQASKPLPTQQPIIDTALSDVQGMLEYTSAVQGAAAEQAAQVTNTLDYHQNSPLLAEANATAGGVVEMLRNSTDKPGFFASILPGSNVALGNDVTEFLVKKAQDLSTQGAPKELVNRVILGTIARIGGKTSAWSGNMSFNKKNFNAEFANSIRQEMLHGKALSEQKSLEIKKANSDAENMKTLTSLQNEIQSALTHANMSNTPFKIPPATQAKIDEYRALREEMKKQNTSAPPPPVASSDSKGIPYYNLNEKQIDALMKMAGGSIEDTAKKENVLRTAASQSINPIF